MRLLINSRVPEDIPDEPECIAKTAIHHKFRDLWRSQWQAREDCRQTKFFRPKAGVSSWDLLTKPRKKISLFTQIMTGHNFLKRHESLVQGTTDSECRLCLEEEETSIHVFFQCQALRQQRIQIFRSGFLDQSQPWPLKMISSLITEASIGSLLDPTGVLHTSEAE